MLTRPVLLWDGGCGFCRRWVGRIERWDRDGRIETIPAAGRAKYPELLGISDQALDHAMHLVMPDRRVFTGGDAVPELARLLPRWRWVVPVFAVPGAKGLTHWIYRRVAARRHQLGCRT